MRIIAIIRKSLIMQFRDYWALLLTILSAPFFIFVYFILTGGGSSTYSVNYLYEDAINTSDIKDRFVRELNAVKYADRELVSASSNYFYGTDTRTGKLLWKIDFVNQRELNLTDAICLNDYVFLTSGYGMGCMLIRLKPASEGLSVEKVWQSKLLDNHHGGVILHNGFLYGSGSNSKGWFCLDFLTGKQAWKAEGKGSVTFADGMLYTLDERGTMRLVKATPGQYEKTGEFKVPKGGDSMYWAHPVVCGGRLYIRHDDKLFAYNISQK